MKWTKKKIAIIAFLIVVGGIFYFYNTDSPMISKFFDGQTSLASNYERAELGKGGGGKPSDNKITIGEKPKVIIGETSYFGKKFATIDGWTISSPEVYSATWFPDGHPLSDKKLLTVELQLENDASGLNHSIKGDALIDKDFTGNFNFNFSERNGITDLKGVTFSNWRSSTAFDYVNESINKTLDVKRRKFRQHNSFDIRDAKTLFSSNLFLDPTISGCGTLNNASETYTLDTDVSSTGTCFTIGADNITLDGAGFTVTYANTSVGRGIDNAGKYKNLKVSNIKTNAVGSRSSSFGIYSIATINTTLINSTFNTTGGGSSSHGVYFDTVNISSIINVTGHADSGYGLYWFKMNSHNIIEDSEFYSDGSDAIRTSNTPTGTNNTFSRLDLEGGSNDIRFNTAGFDYNLFSDTEIKKYRLASPGAILSFENTTNARLDFLSNISGIRDSLIGNQTADIVLNNNSVAINFAGFNTSANITLYGIGDRGFTTPAILIDGATTCDSTTSPSCSNFTALTATNVEFNVSSWSQDYSIGEGQESSLVTTCGSLNTPNTIYELQNNISGGTGSCLQIEADNVTFDGKGYKVSFGGGNGIVIQNSDNVIVKNTLLKSEGGAIFSIAVSIHLHINVNDILISNNTFLPKAGNSRWDTKIIFGEPDITNITISDNNFNMKHGRGGNMINLEESGGDKTIIERNNFTYTQNTWSGSKGIVMSGLSNTDNLIFRYNNWTSLGSVNHVGIEFSIFYENISINGNRFEVTRTAIHQTGSSGASTQRGIIYNNLINTTNDFRSIDLDSSNGDTNYPLNTTKTSAINIINGSNIGGNFYAEFAGGGYSETCTDADSDDICDVPLVSFIDDGEDFLPLAVPASGDTQPPNIQILRPMNNTFVNGNVNIRATASDNVNVVNVSFMYENSTVSRTELCSDNTAPYTCLWDTSTFSPDAEGYQWTALATDNAGNTNETTFLFFIDRTIPEFANETERYPNSQPGVRDGQFFTIETLVRDQSGAGMNDTLADLVDINATRNTSMIFSAGSVEPELFGLWNLSVFTSTSGANGFVDIVAYGLDNATPTNNLAETNFPIKVDNRPPQILSIQAIPSNPFNNTEITVSANAFENLLGDLGLSNYTIEETLSDPAGGATTHTGTLSGSGDTIVESFTAYNGTRSYRISVQDAVGNVNTTAFTTVEVQGNAPDPDVFLINPVDLHEQVSPNLNLTFNYVVGNMANCTLVFDGALNETHFVINPDQNLTYGFNITTTSDTHNWGVECFESPVLNTTFISETRTFTINNLQPNVTTIVEAPADPQLYGVPRIYINWTAYTDGSSVDTQVLQFNNVNYTPTAQAGNVYNVTLDSSLLNVATYNYHVYVNNSGGLVNNTEGGTYTINKGAGDVQLSLNGTEANITVTAAGTVEAAASSLFGTVNLTRDGVDANSENGVPTNLPIGLYNYTALSSGDANHEAISIERFVEVIAITDIIPPNVTNLTETPTDPTVYVVGARYEFNATIVDVSGVNTVFLQFGGTNYTPTSSGSVYNVSILDLSAGVHDYLWYANDTLGFVNNTEGGTYTITNATGDSYLLLNGTAANQTANFGSTTNASSNTTYGSITLYRNGADITAQNHEAVQLGVGNYNFTAVSSGDQNHSSTSIERFVHIIGLGSEVNLTLNGTESNITINAGDSILLNGTLITGDTNNPLELYNNGTLINVGATEVSNTTTFSATGSYNITIIYPASQNYTGSSEQYYVDVAVVPDTEAPQFDTIPPSMNINYTQGFNVTFNASDDIAISTFYINWTDTFNINQSGFLINDTLLAGGFYMINVSVNDTSGNINWTIFNVTVNTIAPVINLTLNGTEANVTILVGDYVLLNGTLITGDSQNPLNLYNNQTLINIGATEVSNVTLYTTKGEFNITTTYPASQNYTEISKELYVDVDCPLDYPCAVQTAVGTHDQGNISSLRDIGVGYYNISEVTGTPGLLFYFNISDFNNYSGIEMVRWYDGTLGHNINVDLLNITGSWVNIGKITDGTGYTNQNFTVGNISNYNNTGTVSGRIDHTSLGNTNHDLSIDFIRLANVGLSPDTEAPQFDTIPPPMNINYTQGFDATFNATDNDEISTFFINWTDTFNINQSGFLINDTLLAGGFYMINVSVNDTSGNINWTIFNVTVNRATPAGSISGLVTRSYPYQSTITGSESQTGDDDVTYTLYLDNVTRSNPNTTILGVGSWHWLFNSTQGQNWSTSSRLDDGLLVITQNNTLVLSLDFSPDNLVTNGTTTTVTGTGCPAELTCILYRNDSSVSNPDIQTLEPGIYPYIYNTTGNANYSITFVAGNLTVNPVSNVTTVTVTTPSCRYKKFGYFNLKLPWYRQERCL